jgi:hypothetical protein
MNIKPGDLVKRSASCSKLTYGYATVDERIENDIGFVVSTNPMKDEIYGRAIYNVFISNVMIGPLFEFELDVVHVPNLS